MGKRDVIKHLCDITASAFRWLILTNDMKFTQNIQTSSLPIAMMSLVHDLSHWEGSLLGCRWHNVQPKRKKVPLVAHFLPLLSHHCDEADRPVVSRLSVISSNSEIHSRCEGPEVSNNQGRVNTGSWKHDRGEKMFSKDKGAGLNNAEHQDVQFVLW